MIAILLGPDDWLGQRQWLCVTLTITCVVIGGFV
jgi:hypothetical protein